ncbi:MAG: outer membrane protein assembly factor BamE [Desulfocapsaceae bacterium]|nr:outer membrane protein assembly factor BamE [Desulfocapsaceae bacterium]
MLSLHRLFVFVAVLLFLTSCADKPVRHLASDASLIKPGTTTREDVLTYLGDPDAQQMTSETTERWIYYEERRSTMQKAPYIGSFFSAEGYSRIVVSFEGDTVVDCTFSSHDSDEFDWADDYSWQEKRE